MLFFLGFVFLFATSGKSIIGSSNNLENKSSHCSSSDRYTISLLPKAAGLILVTTSSLIGTNDAKINFLGHVFISSNIILYSSPTPPINWSARSLYLVSIIQLPYWHLESF